MTLFYYAARNDKGKFVRGSLESANAATALTVLRTRALFVSALDEAGTLRGIPWEILLARSVSGQALAGFFRGFATLLRAGVPLARALPICAEGCQDKRLSEALRAVEGHVASGTALSEAMMRQPREFSRLVAGTVKAGEQSSALGDVLDRLALTLERDVAMRKKLATALAYPAVVACVTLGVMGLLLTTTIPTFASMYQQLKVPEPAVLRALVFLGRFLHAPGTVPGTAGAVFVTAIVVTRMSRSTHGSHVLATIRLGLPVVGELVSKAAIARIARLLGLLLDCGVSLHVAVPMIAAATEYPRFHASLIALQQSLAEGSSIASPLEAAGVYPPLFLQLVRVGEETGRIGDMLGRAASYYESDVENAMQRLGALLEPMMIVILGAAVAFIAAAIFIPLYSLIGSIK